MNIYMTDLLHIKIKVGVLIVNIGNIFLQMDPGLSSLLTIEKVSIIGLLLAATIYFERKLNEKGKAYKLIFEQQQGEIKELNKKLADLKDTHHANMAALIKEHHNELLSLYAAKDDQFANLSAKLAEIKS